MSHFVVTVLLNKKVKEKDYEKRIEELLEPYCEHNEVEEYEEDCWCVGKKAEKEVYDTLDKKLGKIDDFREKYKSLTGMDEKEKDLREKGRMFKRYREILKRETISLIGVQKNERCKPDSDRGFVNYLQGKVSGMQYAMFILESVERGL